MATNDYTITRERCIELDIQKHRDIIEASENEIKRLKFLSPSKQ